MKSKAEVIREKLAGLQVLDIGGSGYGGENAYEKELKEAWALTTSRTVLDHTGNADITRNLDVTPIPPLEGDWDVTTAFDVLEHLECPCEVLRWIPSDRLIVNLPNGLSPLNRRMELTNQSEHLYSFTPYTASYLMKKGGWKVENLEFTFGKWSLVSKMINLVGSIYPPYVGTGILLECVRA